MPDILALFAKWPRTGPVKTRLAADTTPEFAAQVADAFLRDCMARLATVPARRILAFDPPQNQAHFAALVGDSWELVPQSAGDLGERLDDFFQRQFADGANRIIVLGTDSPTLPLVYVRSAFEMLKQKEVVIGPATDGGYYLVGASRPAAELFHGIAWSGPNVLLQTVERLGKASLGLLPPWYDVDTLDDWQMLRGHLTALRRAGIDPMTPHTEALIIPKRFDPIPSGDGNP